jgi:hypothetical protein
MLIPRIPVSWYAVAALSVALVGSVWALKRAYEHSATQTAQIKTLNLGLVRAAEQRALDRATLDRLAKKNAATARETALAGAALQQAIKQNQEWGSQPVPKEVQDALRQP